MGRHLQGENSDAQLVDYGYHPGCMWGIFHVLDYHHWHDVKKVLSHRNHRRGYGDPKTISTKSEVGAAHGFLDAKADHCVPEKRSTRASLQKPHKKPVSSKEKHKGEEYEHQNVGFSAHPQLQQIDSIHPFDYSDYHLGEGCSGWMNPVVLIPNRARASGSRLKSLSLPNNAKSCWEQDEHSEKSGIFPEKVEQALNNQKQMDKKLNGKLSNDKVKEYVDIQEIFKVKKDIFMKILQDPDVGITKQFPGTLNRKLKLTKSGSFPANDSSGVRYLRPTTLEHKKYENWSSRIGENLLAARNVPKSDASKSQKDHRVKSEPEGTLDNLMKQKTSLVSFGSSSIVDNQGWNQMVLNHFKVIKKRIKHVLKEKRKKNKHTTRVSLQSVPSGSDLATNEKVKKEASQVMEHGKDGVEKPRNQHETDISDYDLTKNTIHLVRRTRSLNESVGKYVQLFERSFGREVKWNHSKSLSFAGEDKVAAKGHAPKFFRRISSLSDLESFCSLVKEVSGDALSSNTLIGVATNSGLTRENDTQWESNSIGASVNTDKVKQIETEYENDMVEKSESGEEIDLSDGLVETKYDKDSARIYEVIEIAAPANEDRYANQYQDSCSTTSSRGDLQQQNSVSGQESYSPGNLMGPLECPFSEGSDVNLAQNMSAKHTPEAFYGDVEHDNVEYVREEIDSHPLHVEVDEENDACFSYVREVLDLSGFLENNFLGKWHSKDQPLDPSLFKKFEAYLHNELELSKVEVGSGCDHHIWFGLIDQALLEIHGSSFTYLPKSFSLAHRFSPMSEGHRVLREVWSKISWHLSSNLARDQSLDDFVARDLRKGDGWMNLHLETDFVAIDLEDLIFEELLDEILD